MGAENSISVTEFAAWREAATPHLLLDVREASELSICRLEDALHIPMQEIPARRDELPADLPLIVMCHHGMRSGQVVQFLRAAGLENAVNLEGGIDAWARQVDPGTGRY